MTMAVADPGQPLYWLGGQIDVRVEIDTAGGGELGGLWGVAQWGAGLWASEDATWFDMTAYVLEVAINRGAERWGERFNAGTARIRVDNTSGIFTPDSGVPDPWTREFRLGRQLRVVAIPDPTTGTRVPLFTGRLDAVADEYAGGGGEVVAVLDCFDFMADWAQFDPLAGSATGVQSTDARVNAALDRFEWLDARDIQAGLHTMQSSDLAQTTLEECQRAADAEGGAFFAAADGTPTFKARDWLTTDTRSTEIQGYIGYDTVPTNAQAAHLIDPAPARTWERARVNTQVHFARVGGTMQVAEDAGAVAQRTGHTYERTDFQNNTDAEVLALAVKYLVATGTPRPRADAASIQAVADPANEDLNRLLWATEFGDRLALRIPTRYGWETVREVHVFGIEHAITADDWVTTLRLDDAQTIELAYWTLEDPILGVLGETTRVM